MTHSLLEALTPPDKSHPTHPHSRQKAAVVSQCCLEKALTFCDPTPPSTRLGPSAFRRVLLLPWPPTPFKVCSFRTAMTS
eukprot:1159559-Pelagomonas_calceolata.AAC.3